MSRLVMLALSLVAHYPNRASSIALAKLSASIRSIYHFELLVASHTKPSNGV